MVYYGLYIYDRHTTCVFYHNFAGRLARPGPGTLVNVYPEPNPPPPSSASATTPTAPSTKRLSSLNASSDLRQSQLPPWERNSGGVVVADASSPNPEAAVHPDTLQNEAKSGLAFDEESKLVYGIIFSLRNLVKKLAGRDDDSFHSYSTSAYKLHYLHTATSYHFVLVTSPIAESLRFVLRQIYTGAFTEWVARNPMVEMDSARGKGIDNDAFRAAVEKLVLSL